MRKAIVLASCSVLLNLLPVSAQDSLTLTGGWQDTAAAATAQTAADAYASTGGSGDKGSLFNNGKTTNQSDQGVNTAAKTAKQNAATLMTGTGLLAEPQALQPTTLDSFVHQSGYNDQIYGDEGTSGPPPYSSFSVINDGINSGGLTTGHPSDAPSAWY